MIFYLKPPMMEVELSRFSACVRARFVYFMQQMNVSDLESLSGEAVIPNTELDNISHFTLRCFALCHPDLSNFIYNNETNLFVHRLNTLTPTQMINFCSTVQRHTPEMKNFKIPTDGRKLLSTIQNICVLLSREIISKHIIQNCNEACTLYKIDVQFQMCLSLVRARKVNLNQGIASVPCGRWKEFLKELFQLHYSMWLNIISTSDILFHIRLDERWISLFSELIKIYNRCSKINPSEDKTREVILASQVDLLSQYFPPCMLNLLNTLRNNHRLHHNARYNFSLFLKDIGMPMKEAMEFWKWEYMKPHSNCSSCVHSWENEKRRYIYSIRHLYGLEGSKIVNFVKNCPQMQDISLSAREEGGCPFIHSNEKNLLACLSQKVLEDNNVKDKIISLTQSGNPSNACTFYLSNLQKISGVGDNQISTMFQSPAKYYFLCRNSCTGKCEETQW